MWESNDALKPGPWQSPRGMMLVVAIGTIAVAGIQFGRPVRLRGVRDARVAGRIAGAALLRRFPAICGRH
jgi:hypothetical protein